MTPTFPRRVTFGMSDGSTFEPGTIFTATDEDAARFETDTMTRNMADPVFAEVMGSTPTGVVGIRTMIEMPDFVAVVNHWSDNGRSVTMGNHTRIVFPHRFPRMEA